MPSVFWLVIPFVLSRYFALHDNLGAAYPLTIFFATGMWLVVFRYQTVRDRAVPFKIRAPNAADPAWESVVIEHPSLESHIEDRRLQVLSMDNTRRHITCYDPATAYHLNTVPADTPADIAAKIMRADIAQKQWRHTTLAQRRKVIRSLKKWLVDNQQDCARVACRDTGKTLLDAALGEVLTTAAKADYIINYGEDSIAPESRNKTNIMLSYKRAEVHYEPLGTVAAIVSWNYPLHNSWSPIMAALFAGNAIVLKCSEHVVWSSSWFVGAIRECLRACGYSEELVQILFCYPEDAYALTKSPLIKHITFIGSETVGRIIAMDATEHLTPCTLELGGKDPAIILPNTDLNKWISLWMRGVYQNAGQNCIGIERLIVHVDQYNELYKMMCERAHKLRTGAVMAQSPEGHLPTVDVGAMINSNNFDFLRAVMDNARETHATVDIGGGPYIHPYHDHGSYYTPSVVGDPEPGSRIATEELFAPVAVIMTYERIEEAIDIANSTPYGLGASVFGTDQDECYKVAQKIDCGMVAINDFAVFYLNQDLPFGGTKRSGYGRFGGPEGLRSLTAPKAIIVDRWPWLIQTGIPGALDYPIRSITGSWEFVSGLISLFFGDSYRAQFDGLVRLLGARSR